MCGGWAVAEEALKLKEVLLVEVIADPGDEDAQGTDDDGSCDDGERLGVGVCEEGRAEAVGEEGVEAVVEDVEAVAVLAKEAEYAMVEDAGRAAGGDQGHGDEGSGGYAGEGCSEGLLDGTVVEAEAVVGECHGEDAEEAEGEDLRGCGEGALAVLGAE